MQEVAKDVDITEKNLYAVGFFWLIIVKFTNA